MAINGLNIMKYRIILSVLMFAGVLCKAGPVPRDTILTSSVVRLDEDVLEKMAGQELRTKILGRIPGLEVVEHSGKTTLSTTNHGSPWFASGNVTFASKGWSVLACFIDGVPVPFSQFYLDPNQIESVEYVTDVADKAAVNPIASSGAIMIRTRQGQYNSPMKVSVMAESGVGFVDKMPEWVDGVTYAKLNNLARGSARYPTLYSNEAIAGYAKGNMYDRMYPNVDYKSLILRNFKPTTRFAISMGGGGSNVKYHVAFNGLNDGDIYKVGPVADYNRLNVTSSITARIGRWIEARASFLGLISFERGNRSDIHDYRSVPAVAFPVALGRSMGQSDIDGDEEGTMIYAVSRAFTSNPYAEVVDGGFFSAKSRSGMFNADVNIDLGFLADGLKTRSHLTFGSYYFLNVGKNDDYLAYYWDPSNYIVDISSHLGTKQAKKSGISGYSYQTLNFTQDLWYELRKGRHEGYVKATFNLSNSSRYGSKYQEKYIMGLLTMDYAYDNRYSASVSLQYSGASPYAPGRRFAFFPSVGFAWQASNEAFLKDVDWIDRLKVHAQAGRVGYADVFDSNYRYQANYDISGAINFGPATAYQWFGTDKQTATTTELTRLANPELTWPKIDEFDLGVDFGFLDGVSFGLKGYLINRTGIHTNTIAVYSDAYGWDGIAYYENYNAKRTIGGEVSLGYARSFGDFSFNVNGWAMSWKTTNTIVANDNWLYEWQKQTGADESAYRGYVCIGKFENDAQIESMPKLSDTDTQIGDLMYKDLNGDNTIDENDKKVIGNLAPRLRYALNLDFNYKNFGLAITGTGRAFYDVPLTSGYFWGGWGDGVYSQFMAENIGGAYPRLSYDKSTTNFVSSTFWLRKGGFFKLKSVQLSYTLYPDVKWIESVRFTLTGGNLCTFTQLEYVDPEDIDAGVSLYPFFRTVMAGVKVSF